MILILQFVNLKKKEFHLFKYFKFGKGNDTIFVSTFYFEDGNSSNIIFLKKTPIYEADERKGLQGIASHHLAKMLNASARLSNGLLGNILSKIILIEGNELVVRVRRFTEILFETRSLGEFCSYMFTAAPNIFKATWFGIERRHRL